MKSKTFKIIITLLLFNIQMYADHYNFETAVEIDGLEFWPCSISEDNVTDAQYYLRRAKNAKEIIIPDSVEAEVEYYYNGESHRYAIMKFPVYEIRHENGIWPFIECKDLEKITIPATISRIDRGVFSHCPKLREINLVGDNEHYFVQGEAMYYRSGIYIYGKPDIYIHTVIPKKAGETFFIADSITDIFDYAFANCAISKFVVDENNTEYSSVDGILCFGTVVYVVPPKRNGVLSLPLNEKFSGVNSKALYQTSLDQIVIWEKLSKFGFLQNFPKEKTIYALNSVHDKIKEYWGGKIGDLTKLYPLEVIATTLTSFQFSLSKSDDIDVAVEDLSLSLKDCDVDVTKKGNGFCVENLNPASNYILVASFEEKGMMRSIEYEFKTQTPKTSLELLSKTQTTLTFRCFAAGDETISCEEYGVYMNDKYYKADKENQIYITNLTPNTAYKVSLYARYENGYTYITEPSTFGTKNVYLNINAIVAPTSINCTGICDAGDLELEEFGFSNENADGEKLILTGLEPGKKYTVSFFARTKDGYSRSVDRTFVTPELELTTLQPKCVSNSCAIVAATTNISEDETNVGFQWHKYDAPASIAPNEGYAAIYNGKLEGYVKNLQSTSYYNVRSFYKSEAGNYYYGDWVTFDPSDFSYFEPTVHTYEATEIGSSTARVKGYVLAGTEDIEEQGFEYWPTGTVEHMALRVKTMAEKNVSTIFCTGQVMSATLTDLLPSCTYCVRSFVKTASGTTYGEEQTFTTNADMSEINDVVTEVSCPVVIGYFDLSGRKYNVPQKGLNIVRYTDGSAQKILVK